MAYDFLEITPEMDDWIKDGDKDALRGILVGMINRDPTFATRRYEEALDYIVDRKGLEIHDAERRRLAGEYELSAERWDKEYFRQLLVWLSQNFVEERVAYIREVGRQVYAAEHTWGKEEAQNFSDPITQEKGGTKSRQSGIGMLVMAAALTVGLVLADISVESKLVIVILAAVAAVGIFFASSRRKDQ